MPKKTTVSLYLDGTIHRSHNRRISVLEKDGGIRIILTKPLSKGADPNAGSCQCTVYNKKVMVTELNLSKEGLRLLVNTCIHHLRNQKNINYDKSKML